MVGWIKLHRKVLDNRIWRDDPTAWRLFEYLLLSCDTRTGQYTCGREQLSRAINVKPITTYKALKRLEIAQMVTLVSNNRFTTVSIVNWGSYQQGGNNAGNNKVTTEEQQPVTLNKNIYINKNKELRNYNAVEKKLLKFFASRPEIRDPEAYLGWVQKQVPASKLEKLLAIEFPKWKEYIAVWNKSN
jgi:hypothetical protein